MDKKSRCLNCGSSRLHIITTSHNIFCRDCCATYPMSKYANAPAPSQPCKWYGNYGSFNCACDKPLYRNRHCPGHAACKHYEPKGAERKVPCKWYQGRNWYDGRYPYHAVCSAECPTTRYNCWGKNCFAYEPKGEEHYNCFAGSTDWSVQRKRWLSKGEERKVSCKWLRDGLCLGRPYLSGGMECGFSNMANCGQYKPAVAPVATGTVSGSILDDVKAGDILFSLDAPRIGPLTLEFFARCHNLLDKIRTNKEDIDMSGNAYFCDSCRGTFPREEVYRGIVIFERENREGETTEKDKLRQPCICTKCYARFREVVATFNFPWDEWRKGDDDEG